jgi:hypothetical protein
MNNETRLLEMDILEMDNNETRLLEMELKYDRLQKALLYLIANLPQYTLGDHHYKQLIEILVISRKNEPLE